MMKKIFTIALLLCAAAAAQAQVGTIRVEQEPRIAELLRKHVAYNARHPKIDGFRIRIFSDNGSTARSRSEALVTEFAELYAEVPVYRGYDNPYFKVSVGDFRSKDDALKLFVRLKRDYPKAYIVAEEINLPPL